MEHGTHPDACNLLVGNQVATLPLEDVVETIKGIFYGMSSFREHFTAMPDIEVALKRGREELGVPCRGALRE